MTTNTTAGIDLDHLEALARAATPQNIDSAEDASRPTGYIECPECGGEGTVELTADYCNYDGKAMGVQFYGVGPEHLAAEAFFRAANPATVLQLIQLVRRSTSERGDWIGDVIRDVAELPDRDSPNDQPEILLVAADELRDIIAARAPKASGSDGTAAAVLAARAEGRAEAVEILAGLCPETGLDDYIGWSKPVGPEDEGSSYWKLDKLRELFKCDDKLHNLFDRAEEMYWRARGEKDQAEMEMRMVERAPFYKPLHDFLSKHQAYDLMGDLKRAAAATSGSDGTAAAIPELHNAFVTLESNGGEGRTIVLKFNNRSDAYAVHDFLLKGGGQDYRAATSGSELVPDERARKIMFAAYSRCVGDDRLSPNQIADVLLSARASLAQQAATCQPLADERAGFEAHYKELARIGKLLGLRDEDFIPTSSGGYSHMYIGAYWHGWKARATIAHQSPSIDQQGGAPADELLDMLGRIHPFAMEKDDRAKAYERLERAYCIQQPWPVPDQACIVWRADLMDMHHDLIHKQACFDSNRAAPAPAAKADQDAMDAEPVISSYDLEKVKSLKYKFVDELIHSGVQYRTCGAISATLNQIIDDSAAAMSQAKGAGKDGAA